MCKMQISMAGDLQGFEPSTSICDFFRNIICKQRMPAGMGIRSVYRIYLPAKLTAVAERPIPDPRFNSIPKDKGGLACITKRCVRVEARHRLGLHLHRLDCIFYFHTVGCGDTFLSDQV